MRVAWEVGAPYRSREEHQLGNKKEKEKKRPAGTGGGGEPSYQSLQRAKAASVHWDPIHFSLSLLKKKKKVFSSASSPLETIDAILFGLLIYIFFFFLK